MENSLEDPFTEEARGRYACAARPDRGSAPLSSDFLSSAPRLLHEELGAAPVLARVIDQAAAGPRQFADLGGECCITLCCAAPA